MVPALCTTTSGLVATNARVVDCCRNVTVILGGIRYQGTVLGRDDRMDLAVVRRNSGNNFKPAPFGSAGWVSMGDDVMALGFPLSFSLGSELTVTRGIVSSERKIDGYDYFRVSAGAFYTCGVKTDCRVVCPGSNNEGQATPP